MLALLERRESVRHAALVDVAVERAGVGEKTAYAHVRWLRRFGLVWTTQQGKRLADVGLTVLGRDWLAAIPTVST